MWLPGKPSLSLILWRVYTRSLVLAWSRGAKLLCMRALPTLLSSQSWLLTYLLGGGEGGEIWARSLRTPNCTPPVKVAFMPWHSTASLRICMNHQQSTTNRSGTSPFLPRMMLMEPPLWGSAEAFVGRCKSENILSEAGVGVDVWGTLRRGHSEGSRYRGAAQEIGKGQGTTSPMGGRRNLRMILSGDGSWLLGTHKMAWGVWLVAFAGGLDAPGQGHE